MTDKETFREHPDDKAAREQSEREAAEFGHDAIIGRWSPDEGRAQLERLLTVYADSDALALLDELREWFWAKALPDEVAQAAEEKRRAAKERP